MGSSLPSPIKLHKRGWAVSRILSGALKRDRAIVASEARTIRIYIRYPVTPFCYHSFDLRQLVSARQLPIAGLRLSTSTPTQTNFGYVAMSRVLPSELP
jgi:hypothetical protein